MLHRSEGIDILPVGKHDNSAGVLSGAPADTGAALYNTVNLALSLSVAALFKIILHIPERCLIRQCSNGSGTEGLAFPEDDLRILMGIALIIT